MGPYEEFPIFFGHLNFIFHEAPLPEASQSLQFCASAYGIVTLSPGSSQLPPDVLGDILRNRLSTEVDPAVFSASSFPSWFALNVQTTTTPNVNLVIKKPAPMYVDFA
jgi:hypothetical protein